MDYRLYLLLAILFLWTPLVIHAAVNDAATNNMASVQGHAFAGDGKAHERAHLLKKELKTPKQ